MSTKRILFTGFLAVLLCLCLAVAAFAEVPAGEIAQAGETVLQQIDTVNTDAEKVLLPVTESSANNVEESEPAQATGRGDQEVPMLGQAVSHESADPQPGHPGENPVMGVESASLSAEESQMASLVNQERVALGLGALSPDATLVKLARLKAQDMVDNRYFDHNSPTYGSPFDMMKRFGVSYNFAGENLAMAGSVTSAHKALMESPGHRANILNKNYDRVGIGIVVTGGYRYCVQLFTGGQRETAVPAQPQPTPTPTPTPATPTPTPIPAPTPSQPSQPTDQNGLSAEESQLFSLINQERQRAGVALLASDAQLFKVARLKAQDFVDNNYFSHTSPTYGPYRSMLTRFGIQYVNAGENLAASYSASRAHTALMASTANKANILNSGYKRVGIGIAVKGSYKYYVEMFVDGGVAQPPAGGGIQPPAQPPVTPGGGTAGTTAGLTADEQKMLDLVNSERAKMGLSQLSPNLKATEVARLKARDMIAKNYFSHTSPTYGSPFDMMKQFGISYRYAGENLAGAPSTDIAHTNLMNSPGHRANILNSNYREVGIGIVNGGPYGKMFVQMFIG